MYCLVERFRPYGRSLLADARMAGPAKSNQKVLPLASGPTSSGSLAPSLLQGHAAKGRPWPIAALAASMPLNPLRNDSTRPPDVAFGVACEILAVETEQEHRGRGRDALAFAFRKMLKQRGP